MIGGGVGFGLMTQQRAEQVDAVLDGSNPDELTRAETSEIAAQGDRFRAGQIGSLAGGGVVLVAGAALLVTGLRRKRQSNLSVFPVGRTLTLRGSF